MLFTIKHYFNAPIRYWFTKKIEISVYYHPGHMGGSYRATIWYLHKLEGSCEHEGNWVTSYWKHYTLWSPNKKKPTWVGEEEKKK